MALTLLIPSLGEAQVPQVTTNISSSGLNTQVNQVGNQYNITGGTRPGGGQNLFHSFGDFSVGPGDTANFSALNLPPGSAPIANVLGRVTGGNISNIYGTLRTTEFGTANLFLMNPSGIVLGPGASLNVGGSVSFTTAQYLRLLDNPFGSANFYANPANDGLANSILTINSSAFEFVSGSPAGYGFLTTPDPNAIITVQGGNLVVPSGQSISLVGGKVVIEGGAKLSAPGGSINLATAASPGEFDALTLGSLSNADGASFTSYGSVSLLSGSSIDVHGAGTVLIKGGQLVLSVKDATLSTSATPSQPSAISLAPGSSIITSNSGTDVGVDVQLAASTVTLNGSFISTETGGTERGGNITVTAGQLNLDQFAGIFTGTGFGSQGAGGNVLIQGPTGQGGAATSVTLSDNSQIVASTIGDGLGGNISITTTSLDLSGGSSILSSTTGTAPNGNILLRVQDARLTGGSTVASDTSSTIDGLVGGSITVQGLNGGKATSVIFSGQDSGIRSQTFGANRLGDIVVQTETLKMMDGARINAGEPLSSATAGTITIDAGVVDMTGQSRITSNAFSLDAGPVTIRASQFTLDNSTISADTSSSSGGRGGNVILDVGSARLSNGATITSSASNTGHAGNITIGATQSMAMTGGSTITASSTGSGNAGQVLITTPTLTMNRSSITTTTSDTGNAGSITANVGSTTFANGSQISSSSTGMATGNAGSITIQGLTAKANTVSIFDSALLTTAEHTGQGGSITVHAVSLALKNATISASVKDVPTNEIPSVGTANISLSGESITLNSSRITAESLGSRNAGNILINRPTALGQRFEMLNSQINTSAALADGGNIEIYTANMVRLTDSTITSSVGNETLKTTQGGNIIIDPDFVVLQRGDIRANAFAGSGGAINITSGLFLADASSVVDASSTLGVSGTVLINSPINNLSSVVARLPESLLTVHALLRASCSARLAQGETSSFVERGRDGIPTGPDGLLASPYMPTAVSQASPRHPNASAGVSAISPYKLYGRGILSSVTLFSDRTACSP